MRGNRVVILLALVLFVGAVILGIVLLRGNNQSNTETSPANGAPTGQSTVITPTATPPPPKIVVAKYYLPQGTLITDRDIDTIAPESISPDDVLATDMSSVLNHYTLISFNKGQPLRKDAKSLVEGSFSNYMRQLMLSHQLEPGKKAFPVATNDLSGVAGLIREGDLVDVVATFDVQLRPVSVPGPNGTPIPVSAQHTEPTTKTILQNVRVLKVIQLQVDRNAFDVAPRPVPTPTTDLSAQTPIVYSGTPIPTPTLINFAEAGSNFPVTTVLVLAVDDQQAELLKFTRETSVCPGNTGAPLSSSAGGATGSGGSGSSACVPPIHFVLRAKPLEPSNPQDPNITNDATRGITFRALVRDYGVPIPDLVFATQAQQ